MLIFMIIAVEIGHRKTEILKGITDYKWKLSSYYFAVFFLCTVYYEKPLQEHYVDQGKKKMQLFQFLLPKGI